MKNSFKNSFAFFSFFFLTVALFAQTEDTLPQNYEEAISQQEMLFTDYNTKIEDLKAKYRVDLTDFEKEDLTDKIWFYQLSREVAELKIKFLKKEVDYAAGTLVRPNYEKAAVAVTAFNTNDREDKEDQN